MNDYPEIGKIAVMHGGWRVRVDPHEGSDDTCFSGVLLAGPHKGRHLWDASVLWLREKIERVEDPSPAEVALIAELEEVA